MIAYDICVIGTVS